MHCTRSVGRLVLFAAIAGVFLLPAGVPVAAAGPTEGGMNAKTHKLIGPARKGLKCRICAGSRCTIVTVRGRCTKQRALAALKRRVKQRSGRQRALPDPQLDDRSYKELESESRSRIPRHTPEWSNFNDSDPGVTILETARRNPASIRVQPVPGKKRSFRPEVEDEVILGFEQEDRK